MEIGYENLNNRVIVTTLLLCGNQSKQLPRSRGTDQGPHVTTTLNSSSSQSSSSSPTSCMPYIYPIHSTSSWHARPLLHQSHLLPPSLLKRERGYFRQEVRGQGYSLKILQILIKYAKMCVHKWIVLMMWSGCWWRRWMINLVPDCAHLTSS